MSRRRKSEEDGEYHDDGADAANAGNATTPPGIGGRRTRSSTKRRGRSRRAHSQPTATIAGSEAPRNDTELLGQKFMALIPLPGTVQRWDEAGALSSSLDIRIADICSLLKRVLMESTAMQYHVEGTVPAESSSISQSVLSLSTSDSSSSGPSPEAIARNASLRTLNENFTARWSAIHDMIRTFFTRLNEARSSCVYGAATSEATASVSVESQILDLEELCCMERSVEAALVKTLSRIYYSLRSQYEDWQSEDEEEEGEVTHTADDGDQDMSGSAASAREGRLRRREETKHRLQKSQWVVLDSAPSFLTFLLDSVVSHRQNVFSQMPKRRRVAVDLSNRAQFSIFPRFTPLPTTLGPDLSGISATQRLFLSCVLGIAKGRRKRRKKYRLVLSPQSDGSSVKLPFSNIRAKTHRGFVAVVESVLMRNDEWLLSVLTMHLSRLMTVFALATVVAKLEGDQSALMSVGDVFQVYSEPDIDAALLILKKVVLTHSKVILQVIQSTVHKYLPIFGNQNKVPTKGSVLSIANRDRSDEWSFDNCRCVRLLLCLVVRCPEGIHPCTNLIVSVLQTLKIATNVPSLPSFVSREAILGLLLQSIGSFSGLAVLQTLSTDDQWEFVSAVQADVLRFRSLPSSTTMAGSDPSSSSATIRYFRSCAVEEIFRYCAFEHSTGVLDRQRIALLILETYGLARGAEISAEILFLLLKHDLSNDLGLFDHFQTLMRSFVLNFAGLLSTFFDRLLWFVRTTLSEAASGPSSPFVTLPVILPMLSRFSHWLLDDAFGDDDELSGDGVMNSFYLQILENWRLLYPIVFLWRGSNCRPSVEETVSDSREAFLSPLLIMSHSLRHLSVVVSNDAEIHRVRSCCYSLCQALLTHFFFLLRPFSGGESGDSLPGLEEERSIVLDTLLEIVKVGRRRVADADVDSFGPFVCRQFLDLLHSTVVSESRTDGQGRFFGQFAVAANSPLQNCQSLEEAICAFFPKSYPLILAVSDGFGLRRRLPLPQQHAHDDAMMEDADGRPAPAADDDRLLSKIPRKRGLVAPRPSVLLRPSRTAPGTSSIRQEISKENLAWISSLAHRLFLTTDSSGEAMTLTHCLSDSLSTFLRAFLTEPPKFTAYEAILSHQKCQTEHDVLVARYVAAFPLVLDCLPFFVRASSTPAKFAQRWYFFIGSLIFGVVSQWEAGELGNSYPMTRLTPRLSEESLTRLVALLRLLEAISWLQHPLSLLKDIVRFLRPADVRKLIIDMWRNLVFRLFRDDKVQLRKAGGKWFDNELAADAKLLVEIRSVLVQYWERVPPVLMRPFFPTELVQ